MFAIVWQPLSCYLLEAAMAFPDRIERVVDIAHPPAAVWAALTTAEGLGTWFGTPATIDLRRGGVRLPLAHLRPARGRPAPHLRRVHARAERLGHPADRRRVRLRPAD